MCPAWVQRELSWSKRKTTCPLRLSEDALRNKRWRLGKSLHKWGPGLKESKLQGGGGESASRFCSTLLEESSLSSCSSKDAPPVICYIIATIIFHVTYFTSQTNVYFKFLGALLKGL